MHVEQDVVRLDIPMNDILTMQVSQTFTHLMTMYNISNQKCKKLEQLTSRQIREI